MECPKCRATVTQLYLQQALAGEQFQVCLSCLAAFLWDSSFSQREEGNECYFTIEGADLEPFLKGLNEEAAINNNRKLFRQRNSNNLIIVDGLDKRSKLKCLDVTLDVNSV